MRESKIAQHRLFALLMVMLGAFEWRARVGGLYNSNAALVFPLTIAVGGALLLSRSHAAATIKGQLLSK